ncbi:MAG: DUF465 domain-containing protein [Thermodesulfobacteriota bacterium]
MEKRDEELISRLINQDEELRALVEAHQVYERRLEEFQKRPYLTTEEAIEKKRLQKEKLAGKDRIEAILARHRKKQT